MNELKSQVMQIITSISKDWEEIITTAEQTGEGINLVGMNAKFSEKIQKLDQAFIEAQQRLKKNKKKGFF